MTKTSLFTEDHELVGKLVTLVDGNVTATVLEVDVHRPSGKVLGVYVQLTTPFVDPFGTEHTHLAVRGNRFTEGA